MGKTNAGWHAKAVYQMSEWISVKDRLPELIERDGFKNPCSRAVLTCDGDKMSVGYRWKSGSDEYFLPNDRELNEITHWMPLPEPPNAFDYTFVEYGGKLRVRTSDGKIVNAARDLNRRINQTIQP
jgi:hypothetical protein